MLAGGLASTQYCPRGAGPVTRKSPKFSCHQTPGARAVLRQSVDTTKGSFMPTVSAPEHVEPLSPPRATPLRGLPARLYAIAPLGLIGQVSVSPSTAGMPGANFLQVLLSWIDQIALWGCLIAIICGGALWGFSHRGGNSIGVSNGKSLVLGGAIGAAVCGGAAIIVNTLYAAAKS